MTKDQSATAGQPSELEKRIKKISNWKNLPDADLAAAVQQQILAEAVVPTEAEVGAAARQAKDDEAGLVYDLRSVLLSVNAKPGKLVLHCVVKEAVSLDGEIVERNAVKVLSAANESQMGRLSRAERAFVDAIRAAITALLEAE